MIKINLEPSKKAFFASDFHLGAPDYHTSLEREKKIVSWIEENENEMGALFLVGDIFDFWFEYKSVIPRGFTRFLGKIATLTDKKIPVYFFLGNHDLWMFDYFEKELGVKIIKKPTFFLINNKKICIGHGDGIGNGDYSYKFLKKIFVSPIAQWLFGWLHPNFGVGLASYWSRKSRARNLKKGVDNRFFYEKEWILQYCQKIDTTNPQDFYIFGHRHLPIDWLINPEKKGRYINLGEWFHYDTFAVLENENIELKAYKNKTFFLHSNHILMNENK